MAAAARDMNYNYSSPNSVYGSLAYDLDREVREREFRHAGEQRREEPAAKPQTRTEVRVQTREAQRVSALALLGALSVIAMAVLVLFCYVQLTQISAEVVELKSQLSTLNTDNAALTVQYQQMYDLSTVKEVAEAAGMTKPGASQIYYVDLSGGDTAVVYQQTDPGVLTMMAASMSHGLDAIVEYFE